jgi:dTDP-4-dehydrorhamnose 3,5-epimerase/CDP-3, 6-dideoxy-D-glycero-D-glycero-4-hexulose-5-epimerase
MTWTALPIGGCYVAQVSRFRDQRGEFFKTLNTSMIREIAPDFVAMEAYTSVSAQNVLRGMHYQAGRHAHDKIVSISAGRAHDVLVDLRQGPGFGKVAQIDMIAGDQCTVVFVAKGVAHGFLSLTDECRLNYVTTTEHAPDSDRGILWSSIDHDWPTRTPILSDRDKLHPGIAEVTEDLFPGS